jgi:hypothetical protein
MVTDAIIAGTLFMCCAGNEMDWSSVPPAGLGIGVDAGRNSLVSSRALFYSEGISNALSRRNSHSPAIHVGTNSRAYIATLLVIPRLV